MRASGLRSLFHQTPHPNPLPQGERGLRAAHNSRMDYQDTLERIHAALKPIIGEGKVASYIPELAGVAPNQFGMAVVNLDGISATVGDATKRFSIQSISNSLR